MRQFREPPNSRGYCPCDYYGLAVDAMVAQRAPSVFNKLSRRDVQQARAVRGRRVRPRTPVIRDLSIVAKARALAAEQVELTHPHATSAFDLWRNPRNADRRANRSRSLTAHGSHTKGVRQLLA